MATTPKRNRTKRNQPKPSANAVASGQVRIIAGRWRGRKLGVPDVPGLRPTGDRVRETLFNWLQGEIVGAHCLDLFAGSGALGFEALSRHAQSVTFVEPDPSAYRNLGEICRLLDVRNSNGLVVDTEKALNPSDAVEATAHLFAGTAQAALDQWADTSKAPSFDVVFIDPPFQMSCQWTILQSIAPRLMAPDALVYIEAPTAQGFPEYLPHGCDLAREKRFGDVMARLVRFSGPH